jgi:class 3 adenylate cyclase
MALAISGFVLPRIASAHAGFSLKFIGDGLFAIFPLSQSACSVDHLPKLS